MSINLKQPKYLLPLLLLPFLCLFFYVYRSGAAKPKKTDKPVSGINPSVGEVAQSVRQKELSDKLDAYRNTYKQADGGTAVNPIIADQKTGASFDNAYSGQQKKTLDSISREMKKKFGGPDNLTGPPTRGMPSSDQAMANALNRFSTPYPGPKNYHSAIPAPIRETDPMQVFKQQMAYMDSVGSSNDPAHKAEKQKRDAAAKMEEAKAKEKTLSVVKAEGPSADFNTIMPKEKDSFITAVIDEDLTGYAGSRIRLRLLEDIKAGNTLVKKGTLLYALINGFSGQRVTLSVKSILSDDKLLPVKLDIYDLDGLPGLYIPASAFRDFTKDLGTSTVQGVSIDNGSATGSQFLMSTADKVFQSTSTAIAGIIRKNKARIKYNSYIYLIDAEALQKAQSNYK